MTSYDDDDNDARKPSTPGWSTWHGKCNQSTTRVSMYLMVFGTGELSQTSPIDWEREEGRRQNLSRPVKWSEGKVGKWESGRDATLLIMAYAHDTDVTRIRPRNEIDDNFFFWGYFSLNNSYGPLAVDRKEVASLAWSSLGGGGLLALNEVRSVQPCRREE